MRGVKITKPECDGEHTVPFRKADTVLSELTLDEDFAILLVMKGRELWHKFCKQAAEEQHPEGS